MLGLHLVPGVGIGKKKQNKLKIEFIFLGLWAQPWSCPDMQGLGYGLCPPKALAHHKLDLYILSVGLE